MQQGLRFADLLLQMRTGYGRLQALWKARRLAFQYEFARRRIVRLQVQCRGFLARKNIRHKLWAIITIQAHARGTSSLYFFHSPLCLFPPLPAANLVLAVRFRKRIDPVRTTHRAPVLQDQCVKLNVCRRRGFLLVLCAVRFANVLP